MKGECVYQILKQEPQETLDNFHLRLQIAAYVNLAKIGIKIGDNL